MTPSTTRIGRIVHIARGYTVAEILEGDCLVGFSVFGHRSNTALTYPTREAAIAALVVLADAG